MIPAVSASQGNPDTCARMLRAYIYPSMHVRPFAVFDVAPRFLARLSCAVFALLFSSVFPAFVSFFLFSLQQNNFHVRRCAPPKCFTCANARQKKAQRASMHASAHVDGMYEPHSEKKVSRYTLFKAVCFYDVASPTKKRTS